MASESFIIIEHKIIHLTHIFINQKDNISSFREIYRLVFIQLRFCVIVVVFSVSNITFSILSWTARVSFLWQEEPGEGDQIKCINQLWISSKDITNITIVIIFC